MYRPLDKCCAICLDSEGELVPAPCECKGTAGTVHTACLDRWRGQFRPSDPRHQTCMQCSADFTVEAVALDVEAADGAADGAADPPRRPHHPGLVLVWTLVGGYMLWLLAELTEDLGCPIERACRSSWVAVVALAGHLALGVRGRCCPPARFGLAAVSGLTLLATTDEGSVWVALLNSAAVVLAARL